MKNAIYGLLLTLIFATAIVAQTNDQRPRQVQPQPNNKAVEQVADDNDVLKVETALVTIPVSAVDRKGNFLIDLRQQDFEVFENGKKQEIAYFAASEQPITVVLMLDVSYSSKSKIKAIRSAAQTFVRQLKPQDRVAVVSFALEPILLSEATNDRAKLFRAIEKAKVDDFTSLYDAVDFALGKQLRAVEGRKAVVLFTDGVDTSSEFATFDSTMRAAQQLDAVVYPIKYDTYDPEADDGERAGTSRQEYRIAADYLEDLANATGGKVFDADLLGNLDAIFASVAEQLRYQYNIGYYPVDAGNAGERKSLKVNVKREGVAVRARDNYVVGSATK